MHVHKRLLKHLNISLISSFNSLVFPTASTDSFITEVEAEDHSEEGGEELELEYLGLNDQSIGK